MKVREAMRLFRPTTLVKIVYPDGCGVLTNRESYPIWAEVQHHEVSYVNRWVTPYEVYVKEQ